MAQNTTPILNVSNTSYEASSAELSTAFVAPASGIAHVTVGANMRNNSDNNSRVAVSYKVTLNDPSGAVVKNPSVYTAAVSGPGNASQDYYAYSRTSELTDLIPGQTYCLQVQHVKLDGALPSTVDIASRDIVVMPDHGPNLFEVRRLYSGPFNVTSGITVTQDLECPPGYRPISGGVVKFAPSQTGTVVVKENGPVDVGATQPNARLWRISVAHAGGGSVAVDLYVFCISEEFYYEGAI